MRKWIVLLFVAALLTGCAREEVPAASTTPQTTLENIFTVPQTTQPAPSNIPENTASASKVNPGNLGNSSFGMLKNDLSYSNELGKYILYEGGELHIHLKYSFDGTIGNEGVGAMLLLDGIPQPYKTTDSDEYAYIHTFYPPTENGGIILAEVIFTPITGQAGDTLSLAAFTVMEPDYCVTSSAAIPFRLTHGSMLFEAPVIMEATPSPCPIPAIAERITSLTVSQAELTSSDTRGWSAEDLATKGSFAYGFPQKQRDNNIYQMDGNATLNIHAEVFSPGFVEWSLVVYVDNQPVSVLTENDIRFSVPSGNKIIVDMMLSMAGTDGEMPLYIALVNRNADAPEVQSTSCHTNVTESYFLLEAEDFDAWMALRGQR